MDILLRKLNHRLVLLENILVQIYEKWEYEYSMIL